MGCRIVERSRNKVLFRCDGSTAYDLTEQMWKYRDAGWIASRWTPKDWHGDDAVEINRSGETLNQILKEIDDLGYIITKKGIRKSRRK